ncbi:MAG TPA: glycosyltransferase family A protein [Pirellulales bacterium]|nr:glycosyltransferase family A protein [Pirellulales bacterium]
MISQPALRCHNCGTLEHHYHDDDGRLWLWCGKCKHRWRWHSDTPLHLFKPPVHADHIRRVVLAFPDVTPPGWEDRAEPRPGPAPSARDALVSPPPVELAQIDVQKPWQGTIAKKPWHYRATAVIPHRNTPEHLELCLQFLAQQSEPPYVMIIDTGSDDESLARVHALRSESVEVHQIACHATEEYADTVCYAMDLAMSACRTEYLWCLHSDCFIINRNLLAELLARSEGGQRPAIGYESSSANKHAVCRGMVSHACTLLHMPAMRRLDVTWSRAGLAERAQAAAQTVIFDPEMSLNYRLRERGIEPLILGPEGTQGVERDANRVHLRSGTLTADALKAMPNSHPSAHHVAVLAELRALVSENTILRSQPKPLGR